MNSVTVLEVDNYPAQEVPPIPKGNGKTSVLESLMSSAQRRKLGDISNLQGQAKQMNREETHQQQDMLFSSKEYAEKLQKENVTLMKALAHRNKVIELSGVEFQKLRINLRNVQEKNLQLAQANSHMLAELNTNRDRLKLLQHELGCKNVLLEARKVQLEEQELPCTHHASKDKVHDMNHKDTKRKRTSRIKASEISSVKSIQVKENANSKRKVSGSIDTAGIPEVTCQTEDDIEKRVLSQGTSQTVENIVNKKFVLDAANPVKDSVHSKRQCVRRKSTRFDVPETEQTEKLLEMDDAKQTKETARLSLRRRSARLRPEEAEPCKSFHESDEVRETIKRKRVSSILQSSRIDFQEPEVTETLNADDAGSLVSDGSRSEAVEPSETRHDTKDTSGKRRVSTRRQSTKGKSQTAADADGATKDIVTDPAMRINIVQECDVLLPTTVSQEDNERESKNKTRAEESEGEMRRTSVGRPSESRHDTKDTNGKRRVSTRRQSTKGKSQTDTDTDGAIKDIVTDPSMRINIVQECDVLLPTAVSQEDNERESKNKTRAEETEGTMRRTSVGRPSRHAAEKVQSYREVSLKAKMRRNC